MFGKPIILGPIYQIETLLITPKPGNVLKNLVAEPQSLEKSVYMPSPCFKQIYY